jgi:hypothetical protein
MLGSDHKKKPKFKEKLKPVARHTRNPCNTLHTLLSHTHCLLCLLFLVSATATGLPFHWAVHAAAEAAKAAKQHFALLQHQQQQQQP